MDSVYEKWLLTNKGYTFFVLFLDEETGQVEVRQYYPRCVAITTLDGIQQRHVVYEYAKVEDVPEDVRRYFESIDTGGILS